MAYKIEGKLLEVCSCNVLCPCWIGEDPDGGTCDSAMAWHIDTGEIEGVDVSGQTLAMSVHIPGNVLVPASWKAAVFVSDSATDEQHGAILKVFTGQLGGAIADFAALIGEVVSVERVPITFTVDEGKGRLVIGSDGRCPAHAVLGRNRRPHDAGRDRVQHDPRLAGVRRQGRPLHPRRRAVRPAERRSARQQRAPGSLRVRGIGRQIGDRTMLSVHAGRVHGRDRAILLGSLAAVVAAGWTALVLWGASPWSGYLSHDDARARSGDSRDAPVRRRLDAHDGGDDAADHVAAAGHVPGAGPTAQAARPAGRPARGRLHRHVVDRRAGCCTPATGWSTQPSSPSAGWAPTPA